MTAPAEILQLVETFHRNRQTCKSPACNETRLGQESLNPLFVVLGWDVNNEKDSLSPVECASPDAQKTRFV